MLRRRAPPVVVASGVGMWVTRRVIQALREQSGMSMPIRGAVGFRGVKTTSFVEMLANGAGAVGLMLFRDQLGEGLIPRGDRQGGLTEARSRDQSMPFSRRLQSRWLHTRRGLHLQVQEIAEQDWLLTVLASTSDAQGTAKMVALGATSLAEVAHIASATFVNGVRDERGSPTQRRAQELFLQVW
jgi:hypothetical protein